MENKLGDKLGDQLGDIPLKIIAAIKNNNEINIAQLTSQLAISTTAVEKNSWQNQRQVKKYYTLQFD